MTALPWRSPLILALLIAMDATAAAQPEKTNTPARPTPDGDDTDNDADGYAPTESGPALSIGGYLDLGYANAQGDGTSFRQGDTRLPADYGVDAFAPAVNARGDVASTDSGGRFTNGFLPRSVGIGGRPSAFINTLSFDLRYEAPGAPVMVFSRVQFLPRMTSTGSDTRVLVEQAFGRLAPFAGQEFSISVGKFDSIFGIEYLENQAPLRTGITPSLIARYTTGPAVGAKAFYRVQMAPLWSAFSLHVAATNSGTMVEALQTPDISLSGRPVASGRLGYELNLPRLQVKLGASALHGPRNDQGTTAAGQRAVGADARISLFGFSASAEYIHVDEDEAPVAIKRTGAGPQTLVSAFHARGVYGQLAYALPWTLPLVGKLTPYGRFEQRHAWFGGFTPLTVERITAGLRLDICDAVIVKAEMLWNHERDGAPSVPNNVQVVSAVFYY